MPAKIDIDALKIFLKIKNKIGQKLKTASLNWRSTGSKKEEYPSTWSILKNFEA